MTYIYEEIVERFLDYNNLHKDYQGAMFVTVQMDSIQRQVGQLRNQFYKSNNTEKKAELNTFMYTLLENWSVLGKQLVNKFVDYPNFQESLDAYRWTNGYEEYIEKAVQGRLKLKGTYFAENATNEEVKEYKEGWLS